ncbi:MAG TPA: fatty acid desaturase family protein [Acidimicrobiales bacterium]|nr:fatty acid desaturase family protein [Acidimicrobiales bacterium]
MATTMLPGPELLPDVLPTDRLTATGKPVPEIRAELREIDDLRNVGAVLLAWGQLAATVGLAMWLSHPVAWAAAYVLIGPCYVRFAILGHEAAHRLLFSKKSINDFVGKWLVGYVAFTPIDAYRRSHMAHHKQEFGPEEPDMNLYRGYPVPPDSMRRKLVRDAFFKSGYKQQKVLVKLAWNRQPVALQIVGVQVGLFLLFTLVGRPELYLFLWLLPQMSVWRVLNRLRAIAEHGGMVRSDDRRETTHHVRQSWLARFFLVPYNTGWHLAHHVDIGIPFRNLPQLHRELVASGWVVPELEYPSYVSLWRKLASGAPRQVPVTAQA